MKKTLEENKKKGGEEDSLQESSKLPSGATVKSSSVKEKIKVFNVGNSRNVAHVSETKAKNINVVSATFNQGGAKPNAPMPLTSPSPVASVSNTTVTGDLHVSSTVTNIQPIASVSNTQVTGDLYVKSTVKNVYQMGPDWPLAEKKFAREIPPPLKALYDAYQMRSQNSELAQALAYYVLSEATHLLGSEKRFDLETEIKQYLGDPDALPLLLIQGDSGSGKSLSVNLLEQQLWQAYDAKQTTSYIPIFIELKSIESSAPRNFIQQMLEKQYGYTVQQIQQLRDQLQFVFILDGFDEIGGKARSIYLDNELNKWHAKVIVTCRTQYLNNLSSYQYLFFTTQNINVSFKEIFVAPFNTNQIETYLKIYTRKQKTEWDLKIYIDKLNTLPDVCEFIQSPLLLKIVIEVLPELEKLRTSENKQNITRADIYELFIRKWFERENLRAVVKFQDPYGAYGEFSEQLAYQMFLQDVLNINYKPSERNQGTATEWERFFSSDDPKIIRKRAGCPLRRISESCYSFYHLSFMEYFVAMHLYEEIGLGNGDDMRFKNAFNDLVNTDLNKKLLIKKTAVIEFLANKIKGNETAIARLLLIILASKKNPMVNNAAANAITVAKVACLPRSPFSGKDFSHVYIAGADLSHGIFDYTDFSNADLRGVDFTQAWLRGANLSYSRMQRVQFSEKPYLKCEGMVSAVVYSRDGKYLAVASAQDIELWNNQTGQKFRVLSGHTDQINSVSFSWTGEMLASGSSDCTVRLWEVESGQSRVFTSHTDKVHSVAFSPDGQTVASGSSDRTLRLWETKTGQSRILKGHENTVMSVAYSPNGELLASGSWDDTVRLWNMKSGQSRILNGHTRNVTTVSFSHDGETLASGSEDMTIRLWEIESGRGLRVLSGHSSSVQSLSFSPDDKVLASGSSDLTVRLWDVKSGQSRSSLAGHTELVTSVAFNPDGQTLASGSSDMTVRLWELWEMKREQSQPSKGHTDGITSVAFSSDGQTLASGSWDNTIRLWDVKGSQSRILNGHKRHVTSVAFSPNDCFLASGSEDNTVRVWEVKNGESRIFKGHENSVMCVSFGPDGKTVASGGNDQTIRLWNVESGQSQILHGSTQIMSVAFSPDGQTLASEGNHNAVDLWEVKSGKHLDSIYLDILNMVAYWDWKSLLSRTDVDKQPANVTSISFSPNGEILALGSSDKNVHLVKNDPSPLYLRKDRPRILPKSEQPRVFSGHTSIITKVDFSSDGEFLASGSWDKTARLWEVKSGKCISILPGYLSRVNSVCFKNTDTLATGSGEGAVKIWQRVKTSRDYVWQLQWSSHVSLYCEGTIIKATQGLSSEQQKLLQQRGAQGKPATPSAQTDNNSKSSYLPMWQKKPQPQQNLSVNKDQRKNQSLLNRFDQIQNYVINGLKKEKWISLNLEVEVPNDSKAQAIIKLKKEINELKRGIETGNVTEMKEIKERLNARLSEVIKISLEEQSRTFLGEWNITQSNVVKGLEEVLEKLAQEPENIEGNISSVSLQNE